MKVLAAIVFFLTLAAGTAMAQTTEFNYQGSLQNAGVPANGNYDMQFFLYTTSAGGTSIASATKLNIPVTNGSFSVGIDFGGDNFGGQRLYLEVAVRPAGSGSYTALTPRREFLSTPYAIRSYYSQFANNANILGGIGAAGYVLTGDPRMSDARPPLPNFDITGNGTVSGIFSANQFNIGSNRLIKTDQWNTLTVGIDSGDVSTNGVQFNNSFFGFRAGKNNLGYANSFFGAYSGDRTTGGLQNSFFGTGAGYSNVTGNDNSLFGFDAGRNDLDITPTGSRNTIMGSGAGNRIIGSDNTFVGYRAGRSDGLGTGNANTLVGAATSNYRGQGSYNTFLGYGTGTVNLSLDYATAIGAGAVVSTGSTVQLGRATGDDTVLVPGKLQVQRGFFRVDNNNNQKVSIGGNDSNYTFDVRGNSIFAFRVATPLTGGNVASFGNNGRFEVDSSTTAGGRLIVLENGNVGIGTSTPGFKLDVADRMRIQQGPSGSPGIWFSTNVDADRSFVGMKDNNTVGFYGNSTGGWSLFTDVITGVTTVGSLGAAGSTQLCRNASNEISTCSSSSRYKNNINSFTSGLDLIRKLRPVSFNWKTNGQEDLGLVAEEVATAEPLLTTTNAKGEVEGVKYDRIGVVLINAVKEQQAQIEKQQSAITRLQEQLETQRKQNQAEQNEIKRQQAQIEALKKLVCSTWRRAAACR